MYIIKLKTYLNDMIKIIQRRHIIYYQILKIMNTKIFIINKQIHLNFFFKNLIPSLECKYFNQYANTKKNGHCPQCDRASINSALSIGPKIQIQKNLVYFRLLIIMCSQRGENEIIDQTHKHHFDRGVKTSRLLWGRAGGGLWEAV